MIKSVNYDQHKILKDILTINGLERFDVDLSYGNGSFYKDIPEPEIKIDIDPQHSEVKRASSARTGILCSSFDSAIFDPPFLTYVKEAREHNSVMAKRFGGYWRYDELEAHYRGTLIEASRILKNKGVLIFKCQDIIHNHKMHSTHVNIINWSDGFFRLKDLFVLPAKHRMPIKGKEGEKPRTQKHARIHHSYFLVLENRK